MNQSRGEVADELLPLRNGGIGAFGEIIRDEIVLLSEEFSRGSQIDAEIVEVAGGCAANVAVACASLGVPSKFLGHVGTDSSGISLVESMSKKGVEFGVVSRGRTCSLISFVEPGGERTMAFDFADSRSMTAHDIDETWLSDIGILHINSHHVYAEETATITRELIRQAHELGIAVTLDVSAHNRLVNFGVAKYLDFVTEARPAVIFANEDESELLEDSTLFNGFDGVLVCHKGVDPTVVKQGTRRSEFAVDAIEVVDTTGAGDAFAAGFLCGWMQSGSLGKSVNMAHELAGRIVQIPGAQF